MLRYIRLREPIICDRNGSLFNEDDIEAGASLVLALLDSPELAARLGERAGVDIATAHDPRRVAEQTVAVYRRLLERRKS